MYRDLAPGVKTTQPVLMARIEQVYQAVALFLLHLVSAAFAETFAMKRSITSLERLIDS